MATPAASTVLADPNAEAPLSAHDDPDGRHHGSFAEGMSARTHLPLDPVEVLVRIRTILVVSADRLSGTPAAPMVREIGNLLDEARPPRAHAGDRTGIHAQYEDTGGIDPKGSRLHFEHTRRDDWSEEWAHAE